MASLAEGWEAVELHEDLGLRAPAQQVSGEVTQPRAPSPLPALQPLETRSSAMQAPPGADLDMKPQEAAAEKRAAGAMQPSTGAASRQPRPQQATHALFNPSFRSSIALGIIAFLLCHLFFPGTSVRTPSAGAGLGAGGTPAPPLAPTTNSNHGNCSSVNASFSHAPPPSPSCALCVTITLAPLPDIAPTPASASQAACDGLVWYLNHTHSLEAHCELAASHAVMVCGMGSQHAANDACSTLGDTSGAQAMMTAIGYGNAPCNTIVGVSTGCGCFKHHKAACPPPPAPSQLPRSAVPTAAPAAPPNGSATAPPPRRGDVINAVRAGDVPLVRELLARGADPSERYVPRSRIANWTLPRGRPGFTPLHYAVMAAAAQRWDLYNSALEVASLLLAAGADIEARDYRARTPLMLAVARDAFPARLRDRQPRLALLLLAAGADPYAADCKCQVPRAGIWQLAAESDELFAYVRSEAGAALGAKAPLCRASWAWEDTRNLITVFGGALLILFLCAAIACINTDTVGDAIALFLMTGLWTKTIPFVAIYLLW